jgi:hypothetical protein
MCVLSVTVIHYSTIEGPRSVVRPPVASRVPTAGARGVVLAHVVDSRESDTVVFEFMGLTVS